MSSVVKVTKVRRTAGHVVAILWIQWLRYYVETEEYDRKLPEKEAWTAKAKTDGRDLSGWLRFLANREAGVTA